MSQNSKELKVKYHKGEKPSKKFNNRNPRPGNSGQRTNPGVPTEIASSNITMKKDVPYPVRAVDNLGNEIIMMPGMDYIFPGSVVTEYPMMKAKKGGWLNNYLPKAQTGRNILYVDPNDPEYTKKYPPIYVSDENDPRIGWYTEEGRQFLYKRPILLPIAKAPMLEPSTSISMDIVNDGRGKNVSIGSDRIRMPSGEEVSRSKFIKEYGEGAWNRATNKKEKGGALPIAQMGRYVSPSVFVPKFNEEQAKAEEYINKRTGTTLKQRQDKAGINPNTGKPTATGMVEQSISPIDFINFSPAIFRTPGMLKSLVPKPKPTRGKVDVFQDEFTNKFNELGTYVTDVKPNKWLNPPNEYIGWGDYETGGSKLPPHLPEAYKKGGWLKKYKS